MPVPRNLLNIGLGTTSLGVALGLRDNNSTFLNDPESRQPSRATQIAQIGIGSATTAGILAGTFFASSKYKNPALTAIGMALSAGGAYATSRIYKNLETNRTDPSDTPASVRLLEGAAGLGALYYGGKALAPYVARSVGRLDREARPWFKAFGATVEQARLDNIGDYPNIFMENLEKSRKAFSTADAHFPLQKHLDLLYNIRSKISNTELGMTAEKDVLSDVLSRYTVDSNKATNGIRRATLADAMKTKRSLHQDILLDKGINAKKLALGDNIYWDTRARKIIDLHKYTPQNILLNSIKFLSQHTRIPILNFNPLSVLRPNEIEEALTQQEKFHIFPPGTSLSATLKAGKRGAAFIGGRLHDIDTGKFLGKGLLVKTGRFAEQTTGKTTEKVFRETAWGETLRPRRGVGMDQPVEPGKIHLGNKIVDAPKTWWQKFLANTLEMDIPGVYKTGRAQYESQWDKLGSIVKRPRRGKSVGQALNESLGAVFDPEAMGTTTSKLSAFPTNVTKYGEVGMGFVPQHDIPGSMAFWLAKRPVSLLEGLGIGGFDPKTTRSAADVMWKMVFKRALPIYLSYKLLQLSNDVSHKALGFGLGEIPADLLAAANVGSAYLRQVLGITDLSKYLEELMPGFISASGPSLIRGIGIPLLAGSKFGVKGLAAGTAASLFLGGSSDLLLKTGEEVRGEYYGDKRVAIRGGRWWETGATKFEGSRIKYDVPNWYRRLKSRYQYTDVQYGSEGEYWGSIMDPYHYAIKHYYDRPYPLATSGAEEFPFIGPLIAGATAPPMMMHSDYLNSTGGSGFFDMGAGDTPGTGIMGGQGPVGQGGYGGYAFPQGFYGTSITGTPEQSAPYGINPALGGLPPADAIQPLDYKNRLGMATYQMNEYLGMYGFLANTAKAKLTGIQDYNTMPQLESSERIGSAERAYWEQDFGGLFEQTELFRRFLPHRRHDIDYINPIPNTMPQWIPGADYFKNLRIGDPYGQIPYGEFRMPGAGYEKFYTPGAGIQGAVSDLGGYNLDTGESRYVNYSPLDKYRILSDVAMYSKESKYSAQYIMAMSKAGMLTPEAEEERKRIKKETAARKHVYNFTARKFTEGALTDEDVTVGSYLGSGKFTVAGKSGEIYKLAGIKSITPEGEKLIEARIKSGENINVKTLDDERYKKKTTTTIPTTPVLLDGLNRELVSSGMAKFDKTGPADVYAPLNTRVQYNAIERGVGTAWESISHSGMPFFSKFLHEQTALEEYRNNLYTTGQADWQHPIRDFIMPYVMKARAANPIIATIAGLGLGLIGTNKKARVGLSLVGGLLGLGISTLGSTGEVPTEKKQERNVDQYYDILKYLKYQRLYSYSREKAIEKENIDPEILARSIEASQTARRATADALKQQYTEASLAKLYAAADGKKEQEEISKAAKADISGALEFLSMQKITEDEALRLSQGGYTGAALEFRKRFKSTAYGADVHGDFASIMRALPTKDREFFNAFMTAPKEQRAEIKRIAPLGMRRFLEAKWGDNVENNPNLVSYFKTHHLPDESWVGWHPAVNLDDVKLKTVLQQGFEKHDFNFWDTQVMALHRKPYVPLINPFSSRGNKHDIKSELNDIMTAQGYNNYDISIMDYSGNPDNQISLDVKFATDRTAVEYAKSHIRQLVSPAYTG